MIIYLVQTKHTTTCQSTDFCWRV